MQLTDRDRLAQARYLLERLAAMDPHSDETAYCIFCPGFVTGKRWDARWRRQVPIIQHSPDCLWREAQGWVEHDKELQTEEEAEASRQPG